MPGSDYELQRRQLLQAAAAGIVGAGGLASGISTARAQSGDAPDDDEYETILSEMDGDGTSESPYRITNVVELQAMSGDLEGQYELAADIDASSTASWNDGAGFEPIEGASAEENPSPAPFAGSLEGNGNTISGLTIDRPEKARGGLFAINEGLVGNFTLSECDIASKSGGLVAGVNGRAIGELVVEGTMRGGEVTGGIVGANGGAVFACETDTDVTGTNGVGGVAGTNRETINGVTVDGSVEGDGRVGGIAGRNGGTITSSDAQATVTGTTIVGGAVGDQAATVRNSTATGDVSGENAVGGFAGEQWGETVGITAEGSVDGTEHVGGLVGESHGTLRTSMALGDVSGTTNVGGIVGWCNAGSQVTDVYAIAPVSGDEATGALVGLLGWEFMSGSERVELTRAYWSVDETDSGVVGSVDTGDGEVQVEQANVAGLEGDLFVGENASRYLETFDFEEEWRVRADDVPIPRGQATPTFMITAVEPEELQLQRGEEFELTVKIENTSKWEGAQRVEFWLDDQRLSARGQSLAGGESAELTFRAQPTQDLSTGSHTISIQTGDDSREVPLTLTDGTSGNGADNSTDGSTPVDDDGSGTGESSDSSESPTQTDSTADGDGPGFGLGTAITGLGTGAYLLARRIAPERTAEE